jgi:hypothetical protein
MNMVKVTTSCQLLQFDWLLLQVKENQIQLNVTDCSRKKQLEVTVVERQQVVMTWSVLPFATVGSVC